MARRLKEWPKEYERVRLGRRQKYPWDLWLDGSIWKLVQGEDFMSTLDSMQGTIHAAAKKRNITVKTGALKENGIIVLQAFPNSSRAIDKLLKKTNSKK